MIRKRFTVTLDPKVIKAFQKVVAKGGYSASRAIEHLCRMVVERPDGHLLITEPKEK